VTLPCDAKSTEFIRPNVFRIGVFEIVSTASTTVRANLFVD